MAKRDDIVIGFGGDDSRFRKVARRVSTTAQGLSESFRHLGSSIASVFGVGVGVAGGGITAAIANMTRELDELGKTAEGLNTTVEGLHALRFAVSQTSTVTDQEFNNVLQRMVKHIGQANRGAKESQKLFAELGLSWEYLAGLDSDDAFLEVADAIASIDDSYKQASIAQKLFEDNWRRILPTLRTSREELAGLVGQAREMGGPTTEAAQAAADFNDAIGRLNQTMQAATFEYGPAVIDFLNELIAKVTGSTGATTAIGKLDEELNKLYDQRNKLLGQGNWLTNFVLGFTSQAEKQKAFDSINNQIQDLIEQRKQLTIARQKFDQSRTGAGSPGAAPATGTGKAAPAGKPGPTATDDFLAFQSGEIDRAEWLKRERERNPYAPKQAQAGAAAPPTSFGTMSPEQVAQAVADATRRALESEPIRVKVAPELVGAQGIEWATQDQADKEGAHE